MNQQQSQVYVAFIEQLLNCPEEQETELLQANAELVNADLLDAMEQYAINLEDQGDSNARWLRGFAAQLAQTLNLRTDALPEIEDTKQFLLKTLQLVVDTGGAPQKIYSVWKQQQSRFNTELLTVLPTVVTQLLKQETEHQTAVATILFTFGNLMQRFPLGTRSLNLELSIAAYQLALQVYARNALPVEWAEITNNLASAYYFRIQGDRAENLEQAIALYQDVLTVRTKQAMPVEWAETISNLASAYNFRIRGERAGNLEQAIALYQDALTVATQQAFPADWAQTISNLAGVYCDRIRGDLAENLEQAIALYQDALTVRTKQAMPVEWAATTNNLALAYAKRIQEDRADNLEQAIALYQDALTVRTKQAMPVEWAETLNNLALAYARRIRGDQAENLERAIILYQDALTEMTQLSMPIRWAQILNSLANAYYSRIQGDRTENLEQAIAFYQDALTVRTKQSMPVEWAETLNNLANAYSNRIRGDRAENLEQAIALYQHALTVFTQQSAPINWADSINNLASAYYSRIQGDRAENLEQAIVLYQDALTVRTKQAMPIDWAATTNNLAVAFRNRIQGDRADNLEQAIALYQDALTVRTKQAMPVDWAQTMMNLATTYSDRIRDDRTENLKQAISAYQSCLEVFKPDLFPNDCRRSARSLGNLYSEQQRWEEAALTYQKGLQAAEILYQSAILLDSKAAELTETADLPRRAAYAFARSGNLQTAVLILEQGRARGLSEALNRDRADLRQLQKTHIQLYNQYQDITIQLRNLETQDRLRMTSEDRNGLTPGAYRNLAGNLRQQLDALLQKIRRIPGYEALLTPTTFTEISEAVRDYRPLVYLVSNPLGSLALVVTGSTLECLWLDDFPEKRLREILDGPAEDPEVSRLFGAYQNFRNDPKTNYDIWCEEIEHSAYQLWEPLMLPVIEYLKEQHFQQAILIPTELLNFLPLHVAWIEDSAQPTGKRYALDEILLTYAPNARSLNAAETIARRTKAESILAIDNPLKDLPNSSYEVTAAVRGFTQSKILKHEEATIEAVLKALPHHDVLHLSCHGTANLGEPLNNGLIMCDGLLTLRDILSLKLAEQEQGGIRLATLSACETGLAGIEAADEVISLSTGLLQAGVAGVVTSLWPVSDLSTMLLEVRFYDYWRNDGLEPAIALHQSQQWVRDTTNGEKLAYFRNCTAENSANRLPASTADYLYKSLVLSRLSDRDFAHPFHWAAFSYVGV